MISYFISWEFCIVRIKFSFMVPRHSKCAMKRPYWKCFWVSQTAFSPQYKMRLLHLSDFSRSQTKPYFEYLHGTKLTFLDFVNMIIAGSLRAWFYLVIASFCKSETFPWCLLNKTSNCLSYQTKQNKTKNFNTRTKYWQPQFSGEVKSSSKILERLLTILGK